MSPLDEQNDVKAGQVNTPTTVVLTSFKAGDSSDMPSTHFAVPLFHESDGTVDCSPSSSCDMTSK